MRDQFKRWRGNAKSGAMNVGRWIRRHTVLAASVLLQIDPISVAAMAIMRMIFARARQDRGGTRVQQKVLRTGT